MEKWSLTKLNINSFKVFDNFSDSFEQDLIVFDGPNGYGKTTIFDALQLLFCGAIPRITLLAKSIKSPNRHFEQSLYRHNKSDGDIVIKAEFKKGNESTVLARVAKKEDINRSSNNKPDVFSIFKLFSLSSFNESIDNASLISNEESYIKELFGEFFLKNYQILNYISQENSPLVVPNDGSYRSEQISHLMQLGEIEGKIEKLKKLISECKKKNKNIELENRRVELEIKELNNNLIKENTKPPYKRLAIGEVVAQWDKIEPIVDNTQKNYQLLVNSINILKNIVENKGEIELRIHNEKISSYVRKDEFSDAVRIGGHFKKYDALIFQRKEIESHESQHEVSIMSEFSISSIDIKNLNDIDENIIKDIIYNISVRDKINKEIEGSVKESVQLNELRKDIVNNISQGENHKECPLCGYDYKKQEVLLDAINLKTEKIESFINKKNSEYQNTIEAIKKLKTNIEETISNRLKILKASFEKELLDDLQGNIEKKEIIEKIFKRIISHGIKIDEDYTSEPIEQQKRLNNVRGSILDTRKKENDVLLNGTLNFFYEHFGKVENIEKISMNDVLTKEKYLSFKYGQSINENLNELKNNLEVCRGKQEIVTSFIEKLENSSDITIKTKNDYLSKTIGHIESLFHVYSGRLLQNYQRGLGLFIDTEEANLTKKNKTLSFLTPDGTSYDAVLSMSSGQIAALTLSFFLALNRKYANTAFVLIDDPTQSMDEINIASLSDLLRVELKNRQVIISTHEQEVGDYLRYRYQRAGLKAKSINMQNLSAS